MTSLSPLLKLFNSKDLSLLADFGDAISCAPDEVVLQEGETNRYLYLLLRGRLRVTQLTDTGPRRLAEMIPGDSVGEISIYDPGPTTATVVAVEESELWRISAESMEEFHSAHPTTAYQLVTQICGNLAQRLREANERLR